MCSVGMYDHKHKTLYPSPKPQKRKVKERRREGRGKEKRGERGGDDVGRGEEGREGRDRREEISIFLQTKGDIPYLFKCVCVEKDLNLLLNILKL